MAGALGPDGRAAVAGSEALFSQQAFNAFARGTRGDDRIDDPRSAIRVCDVRRSSQARMGANVGERVRRPSRMTFSRRGSARARPRLQPPKPRSCFGIAPARSCAGMTALRVPLAVDAQVRVPLGPMLLPLRALVVLTAVSPVALLCLGIGALAGEYATWHVRRCADVGIHPGCADARGDLDRHLVRLSACTPSHADRGTRWTGEARSCAAQPEQALRFPASVPSSPTLEGFVHSNT